MILNIAFIVIFFAEMLISCLFFGSLSDRKFPLFTTILIGIALFESGAMINIFLINNVYLNICYSIFVNFIFSALCFDLKKLKGFFYSFILVGISNFFEIGTLLLISMFTKSEVADYSTPIDLVIEIIMSKVLYFVSIMVLLRFIKENNKKIKIPTSFFVHLLILILSTASFWYINLSEYLEFKNQVVLTIVSVALFISTIWLFFAFQFYAKKENQILMLQQEQNKIKTDISYYEILEKQNADLRIYAHDAKNHLTAIRNLNDNPEIELYVSEMLNNLNEYSNVCHSGNKILDVIIDKYVTECSINNIKFHFDVRNNNLIGLEYHDTVSILGNLLDNAIEASVKSKERYISFETDFRNDYSVIIISNSCDTQPQFDDNNTLTTTKKNKLLHGLGLRSVKKTIKKYEGDLAIEYNSDEKMFVVTIMLDLKKSGQ